MKKIALGLVAGAVLSTGARADIDLSFPAGTSTDTSVIKKLTGATGYHNPLDATTFTTSLANNAITLTYKIKMNAGIKPYSATAGLLVPVTKDWQLKDIKKATSIDFEMKATAANKIKVIIGSPLYDDASAKENAALTSADQKITTAFTKFSIATSSFAMPSWYSDCAGDCLTTFFADDGTNGATIEIGSSVEAINFQPQLEGGWNADGSQLTKFANADFTVKNVVIVGASPYADVLGKLCTGTSFQLDAFAATKNPNLSKEGNYWYAFSDTTTDAVKLNDTATGASTIALPAGVKKWTPASGVAAITATLEKNVPGSTFTYHPYAGWATIGIGFGNPNANIPLDLSAITAVQFDMYIGADAATVVTGAAWDAKNVPVLNFKTSTAATPDAAPYQIQIPVTQSTQTICVDMGALTQPSWYNERTYGTKTGPAITTDALMKMAWEMKIMDQSNELLHTSGPNTFAIANVKLFGIDADYVAKAKAEMPKPPIPCADTAIDPSSCPPEVGIKKIAGLKSFSVSYSNGLVLSANVAPTAKIDVLRMNGTVVRSFTADKASSVKLGAGSYLVTVRNANGARTVSPLAVVR